MVPKIIKLTLIVIMWFKKWSGCDVATQDVTPLAGTIFITFCLIPSVMSIAGISQLCCPTWSKGLVDCKFWI